MLVGLQKQWHILRIMADAEKLPHALLLSGPDKIGKKTLALELVKFIFCQEENKLDGFACGKCRACLDVEKKTHPDLAMILPEEGSIKIAQIRDLEWRLSLKPYSAKIKVGIIDDAHLILPDAQNSLLKTLEEPKGKTLLILVSSNPQMLLKTVFSRVQTMKFFLASDKEIRESLIDLGAGKEKAEKIAKFSLGRPGQAIDFLRVPEKFSAREEILAEIEKIIKAKIPERFSYVKKITDAPESTNEILALWERQLRDMLIADPKAPSSFVQSIKNLEETVHLIKTTNVNQRLALENLMLNLNI
ncbi:MAG: DNA polymerase III subunit [Candidatus Paceibacterota bacterium]|jgi:DNA polymerase-3 subunit delta'